MTSAAAALSGWHKSNFMKAVAVSELPAEVLKLFEGKALSFAQGEIFLKVHKAIGEKQMVAHVVEMHNAPKRRTGDQIIAHLLSVKDSFGVDLKIRKRRGRGATRLVFEFSVDIDQVGKIMLTGEDIARIIQMTLAMLQTRKDSQARST